MDLLHPCYVCMHIYIYIYEYICVYNELSLKVVEESRILVAQ